MARLQLNPFWSPKHVLATKLTRDECVARLRANVRPPFTSLAEPSRGRRRAQERPVEGEVSETGFTLSQARSARYRGFRTHAKGTIIQGSNGTTLDVRLGMPWVSRFNVLYVVLFDLFMLYLLLAEDSSSSDPLARPSVLDQLLPLLAMVLITALYAVWHVYQAAQTQGESDFLLRFLKGTLKADEAKM